MFRLTEAEKAEVITICDHLRPLRFSPSLPHAFTEHGAIMLASLLNTRIAVQASVQVVRAFVRLRSILATHKDLARKLEELEKYDAQFKVVFDAIRATDTHALCRASRFTPHALRPVSPSGSASRRDSRPIGCGGRAGRHRGDGD